MVAMTIRNIPNSYTKKSLFQASNALEVLGNSIRTLVLSAYLKAFTTKTPSEVQKILHTKTGHPDLVVLPVYTTVSAQAQYEPPPPRPPTFSLILRGVPQEFAPSDVEEVLKQRNIPYTKLWRIFSRATNEPTSFIRIILESETHFQDILRNGFGFYGLLLRAEPSNGYSNPIPAIPKYCTTCTQNGHSSKECTNKPSCPHCGALHKGQPCPNLQAPKCSNCQGDHPSYYPKCPMRKITPENLKEVAPVRP